jgi:hypothetical protein
MKITKNEETLDYTFNNLSITKAPTGGIDIFIAFKIEEKGWDYGITLSGQEARNFFNTWETDADIYKLLTSDLDVSVEVPEDITL